MGAPNHLTNHPTVTLQREAVGEMGPAKAGASRGPPIAPLVATQIGPNCYRDPTRARISCTRSIVLNKCINPQSIFIEQKPNSEKKYKN